MAPTPKLHRWLDLIAYLAGRRRPAAVDEVMEGVPGYAERWRDGDERATNALRRMFERDKDELRGLGIPIETVPRAVARGAERVDGYRLERRDFYLPYLPLLGDVGPPPPVADGTADRNGSAGPGRGGIGTFEIAEDEVASAVEGLLQLSELPDFPLAREARSAYRKLTFDLDASRFPSAPVRVLSQPGADGMGATTEELTDAVLRRKRVRFRYRGIRRGRLTDRTVAPYGLLFKLGQWYLVGYDASRQAVRVFRVSRMEDPEVDHRRPHTPDFAVPEDFDLGRYGDRRAWELAWDEEEEVVAARVLFLPSRAAWAERNGFGDVVERHPDGSAVHHVEVRDRGAFVRWILSLDGEAEVRSPEELRAEVLRAALAVVERHLEAARV
jgi:proteasome accessory factor B